MDRRKTDFVSAKRAELAANAMLAPARVQRVQAAARRTRFLVWLYPGLAGIPPLQRQGVMRDARFAAYRSHVWLRMAIALLAAAAVGWMWLHGSEHRAGIAIGLAMLVSLAQILYMQIAMRRYIRRVAPSLAPGL